MPSSPAANKRRGATFEIELMKALREHGLDAERLRLAGKDDEGDLVIRHPDRNGLGIDTFTVLEAKSGAMHPAQFVRETETERINFASARDLAPLRVRGIAVVKAPRKPVLQSYVLTTLDRYLNLEG